MVLNFRGKKRLPPDPYLSQPIQTERFLVVNCDRRDAIKVTAPWRTDPEVLHNLMLSKSEYSPAAWVKVIGKPDGRTRFYHAIMDRDKGGTIGTHRISINRSGTADLAIVVHARSWWGKGVFEEIRTAILDHFARSDHVIRFHGRVLSRNFSSIYNYNKLGFRLIGYEQQAWRSPATNALHDTLQYEMLAEDWLARRREADHDA